MSDEREYMVARCEHGNQLNKGCARCRKQTSLLRIQDDPPLYIKVTGTYQRAVMIELLRKALAYNKEEK